MARPEARQPHDWLRPTRPLTIEAPARPDLLPQITNPGEQDLFWGTVLAMLVGALFGLAIVLGLAA